MKQLNNFIQEKLKITKDSKINKEHYKYHPETRDQLLEILMWRLHSNKDVDLNDIDTSKVKSMETLFCDLNPHNIDISDWNVSNVENMNGMFAHCDKFNCDLSKWNVSKVKDFRMMFLNCESFDSDLSNWNVSNGNYFGLMFQGCKSLKNKPSWYKY